MIRHVLDEARIHPAIRQRIRDDHRNIVGEVRAVASISDRLL